MQRDRDSTYYLDSLCMSFYKHVSKICKATYFHIRVLCRSSLTTETAKTIAMAIVGSRLNYYNSLLAGTSASNLARLQMVQNTLARVVAQKSRYWHVTPALAPGLPENQFQNFYNCFFKVLHHQHCPAAFVPLLKFFQDIYLHDIYLHH